MTTPEKFAKDVKEQLDYLKKHAERQKKDYDDTIKQIKALQKYQKAVEQLSKKPKLSGTSTKTEPPSKSSGKGKLAVDI